MYPIYLCRVLKVGSSAKTSKSYLAIGKSEGGAVIAVRVSSISSGPKLEKIDGRQIQSISASLPARTHVRRILSEFPALHDAGYGGRYLQMKDGTRELVRPFPLPPATKLLPGDMVTISGRAQHFIYIGQHTGQLYMGSWERSYKPFHENELTWVSTERMLGGVLYIYLYSGDLSAVSYAIPRESESMAVDTESIRSLHRKLMALPVLGSKVGVKGERGLEGVLIGLSPIDPQTLSVVFMSEPHKTMPTLLTQRRLYQGKEWVVSFISKDLVYSKSPPSKETMDLLLGMNTQSQVIG